MMIRRLRLSHHDVHPTECSVRRCITPDGIGCIMGHAKAPSSLYNFLPQYSHGRRGVLSGFVIAF